MPSRIAAFGVIIGLLAALNWTDVTAQQPPCSLLTSSDIEVATGAKPGDPHPIDLSASGSPTKRQTVPICMWTDAAQQGQLSLSLGPLPPGMSAETIAKKNAGMDALRDAHYTEEEKSFGNSWCSIMTPPASKKDGLIMSSCSGGAKGMVVSLAYTSPTKKISIDKMKALLDKAIGRLR